LGACKGSVFSLPKCLLYLKRKGVGDENEELDGYLPYQSVINSTVNLKVRRVGISFLMLTLVGW
jgi:hypothetical protein